VGKPANRQLRKIAEGRKSMGGIVVEKAAGGIASDSDKYVKRSNL
jgi:hypothetical protein